MNHTTGLEINPATPADVPLVLQLIRELAEYENLLSDVVASEGSLHQALFGSRPVIEAVVARCDGTAAGFALFFHNFSTFLGRAGIYLEDLFVRPSFPRPRHRQGAADSSGADRRGARLWPVRMGGARLETVQRAIFMKVSAPSLCRNGCCIGSRDPRLQRLAGTGQLD